MTIPVQALAQLPFLAKLDEDILQEIAPHIQELTLSPGQVVISEGDPCQAVYFVVQGVVRIRRLSLEGREQVLAYRGPNGSFNLVPVLNGGSAPSTVDALTDVKLYAIPCERFHQIMHDHHEVALAVLKRMASEVRRLGDMVEDLALHPVRTRLARFLLNHAEGTQPPRRWTQEEIATNIGTVREIVGRTLRVFADEGLIRRQRGRIVVVNRERLELEATGR
jgi:CRP/FNR family cyclic AMP-dependent transcriptional regulator